MAEGARLESVYTGNRIVGSNPTPSARTSDFTKYHGASPGIITFAFPLFRGHLSVPKIRHRPHGTPCKRTPKEGQIEGLTAVGAERGEFEPECNADRQICGGCADGRRLSRQGQSRPPPSGWSREIPSAGSCARPSMAGGATSAWAPLVTSPCSDAREEAATLRRAARSGRDPTAERRSVKHVRLTFAEAAEKVHAARKDQWRNGKHVEQWITTLRTYAFPLIGKTPVGQVQAADVLRVLTPIWLTKPETARRVRQRIGVVLDWATTAGHRSNLAVNAAHAVRAGLPKQSRRSTTIRPSPGGKYPMFAKQIRQTPSTELVRLPSSSRC